MTRVINIDVDSCVTCPFCEYIPNYGISYQDREEWHCIHKKFSDAQIIATKADKIHPGDENFIIPEWCPLPKKDNSFEF